MEKLQEMLRKLSIDSESRLNRPIYRAKLFEIEELSCGNKQRKKDRLTLIEAWFGNIPITVWDKNTLEYKGILPTRYNYSSGKVTLPFNYKKYKYKIESVLKYPQFRYRADSKTYVGFSDYDSFILLHNEDRPLFIGSSISSSYANIYNPVWQECSLDLIKELSIKESIRNTLREAGFIRKIDIETETIKIYNEERANENI